MNNKTALRIVERFIREFGEYSGSLFVLPEKWMIFEFLMLHNKIDWRKSEKQFKKLEIKTLVKYEDVKKLPLADKYASWLVDKLA